MRFNEALLAAIWFLGYEYKTSLKYIKISFKTPTFDQVNKDRSAKFVDMLSSIGGTMGLLTGFSIISGVEIVYFTFKTLYNCLNISIKNV